MPACKVCGSWFVKIKPHEELCDKCECALCRLSGYVAPVRHGHWIMKKTPAGASYTVCSHCNASVKYNDEYGTAVMNLKGANYCPNCGCRMDGGED